MSSVLQQNVTSSASRLRLLGLLGMIHQSIERFGLQKKGWPFSLDDVREAAELLCELGLIPAAKRLLKYTDRIKNLMIDLSLTDAARKRPDSKSYLKGTFGEFPPPIKDARRHAQAQRNCRDSIAGESLSMATFLRQLQKDLTATKSDVAGENLSGFVSADTLWVEAGISQSRLSEGHRVGKISTKRAPQGMKDSRLRSIRILYDRADAMKHCKPKHVKKKTIQKLARKT